MKLIDLLLKQSNFVIIKLMIAFLLFVWILGFSIHAIFPDIAVLRVIQPYLNFIYGNFCHQFNDRSIIINNLTLLVCGRCTGVYLGSIPALFLSQKLLSKIKVKKLFYFSFLLVIVDVGLSYFNLLAFSIERAIITGLLLGFSVLSSILSIINIKKDEGECL